MKFFDSIKGHVTNNEGPDLSIVLVKNSASLHHVCMLKQGMHRYNYVSREKACSILKHDVCYDIIITILLRLIVYKYSSMGPGRKHKLDFVKWRRHTGDREWYALLMRAN